MPDHDQNAAANREAAFKATLDGHGHAFQSAFVSHVRHMDQRIWSVLGEEVPVTVGTHETHIDCVLSAVREAITILIVECKRADPARAAWCFARAKERGELGWVEIAMRQDYGASRLSSFPKIVATRPSPCHVGHAIKTPEEKGAGVGAHQGPIDTAATQALQSMSGFVNAAIENQPFVQTHALLIPCVVTTAALFVTPRDLADANLAKGTMREGLELERHDWVWYQVTLSRSLHHKAPGRFSKVPDVRAYTELGHQRSVAIVTATAFEAFTGYLLGEFLARNFP